MFWERKRGGGGRGVRIYQMVLGCIDGMDSLEAGIGVWDG
jgi:hypothetical protein